MISNRYMTQAELFVLVASLLLGDVVAQDATKIDVPSIEGTWIVKESSKNGPIKLVKEHLAEDRLSPRLIARTEY